VSAAHRPDACGLAAGLVASLLTAGCGPSDVPPDGFVPSPIVGAPGLAQPDAPLPFVVSDEFFASGVFGNDQAGRDRVVVDSDPHDCLAPRSPGAQGLCYTLSWYVPAMADWAGLYWQWPANNWGTAPCKSVPPGAKQVQFKAAGAVGGEQVTFEVGGIHGPVSADSLMSQLTVTLTTSWTKYTLPIQAPYPAGVCGAFAWTVQSPPPGTTTGLQHITVGNTTVDAIAFYLDDVRWTM
jgi:hypothetical protein